MLSYQTFQNLRFGVFPAPLDVGVRHLTIFVATRVRRAIEFGLNGGPFLTHCEEIHSESSERGFLIERLALSINSLECFDTFEKLTSLNQIHELATFLFTPSPSLEWV